MPPTLLADLALMMAHSAEDVATRALELILVRRPAQAATNRLLSSWRGTAGPEIVRWNSQVVSEDNGRTDLQGYSAADQVVAVFENKFWATLTAQQPDTYLGRLSAANGGLLVFLVPSSRVALIRHELDLRLRDAEGGPLQFDQRTGAYVVELSSGVRLAVTSWSVVLTSIRSELEAAGELDGLADVRQLEGLVAKMDQEDFRPLTPGDITGDTPRLMIQLSDLVDEIEKELRARPYIDRKNLTAGVGKGYYGPYFRIHGFVCHLVMTAWWWKKSGVSPIWLRVSTTDRRLQEELRRSIGLVLDERDAIGVDEKGYFAGVWIPVRLLEGREKQAVINDAVSRLDRIGAVLAQYAPRSFEEPAAALTATGTANVSGDSA